MLEKLMQLDTELLLYINGINSPFGDNFFSMYTDILIWVPLYALILYTIFKKHGMRGFWILLALVLVITLCDQISSSLIKPGVARLRPTREPSLEGLIHIVNGYRGGRYGFISSHAANSFGLAAFSALLFRRPAYTIFIFLWAIINSYSRMYLGVHYPGDILGGTILGLLAGWSVYLLYAKVIRTRHRDMIEGPRSVYDTRLVIYSGVLMVITIALASKALI